MPTITPTSPSCQAQDLSYEQWIAAGRPDLRPTLPKSAIIYSDKPARAYTGPNYGYSGRRLNGQFRRNKEARYARAGLA